MNVHMQKLQSNVIPNNLARNHSEFKLSLSIPLSSIRILLLQPTEFPTTS